MWRRTLGAFYVLLGGWCFLLPGLRTVSVLTDPATGENRIPKLAWSLHRSLTPAYERWARERLNESAATRVATEDVAGTEWPLFGSCFYLWATESLRDAARAEGQPDALNYAAGAVEAATDLVLDPGSARWVRDQWGENYLRRENVFYRLLLMSAIISHHRLTGSSGHLAVLRQQADGLANELDASPAGLLDDYPRQCYPTDVVAAWHAIQLADGVLGTDHSALIQRGLRGFTGERVKDLGLPPYAAHAPSGRPRDRSRGCGNSYLVIHAPCLWPGQAEQWYAAYEQNFWQSDWLAAGFREFPRDEKVEAYFDVDSGPVIRGIGFAASGFGLAGARVNGRFDHARLLTAMMICMSVPLPDGTLWVPRCLSNSVNAPYLGEAAILYCLTRTSSVAHPTPPSGRLPALVWIVLTVYFGAACLIIRRGWCLLRARTTVVPQTAGQDRKVQ